MSPARMKAHGGVKGGRSHGGDDLDDTMGISDGDGASGGGDPGGAKETQSQGDTAGLEGHNSSCDQRGIGDLEDHS